MCRVGLVEFIHLQGRSFTQRNKGDKATKFFVEII